jgi:hypothetical protein
MRLAALLRPTSHCYRLTALLEVQFHCFFDASHQLVVRGRLRIATGKGWHGGHQQTVGVTFDDNFEFGGHRLGLSGSSGSLNYTLHRRKGEAFAGVHGGRVNGRGRVADDWE